MEFNDWMVNNKDLEVVTLEQVIIDLIGMKELPDEYPITYRKAKNRVIKQFNIDENALYGMIMFKKLEMYGEPIAE